MAIDYGSDVDCVSDLDPTFALVTGPRAVAQAIARRLSTPRGGLHYDGTYGYDLRSLLNTGIEPGDTFRIAAAVEAQCVADERVVSATATVLFDETTERLRVLVDGELAEGPFSLVLGVSAVTVELLRLSVGGLDEPLTATPIAPPAMPLTIGD